MPRETIGLIGLGLLGSALAERILQAGWKIAGFDLNKQQLGQFGKLGGQAVGSCRDVAPLCRRIVLCLPDSDAVEEVVDSLAGKLSEGAVLIDATTGDPQRTAALGQRLALRNIRYYDATIAGSSQQVRAGEAIAMVGGRPTPREDCHDLLATFSRQVFYVGESGSGAQMKLIVNLVLGLNRAVLAEGLSLAAACGVDQEIALEILRSSPAYSQAMAAKGVKMTSGDFTPQARLAQHLKDVELILALSQTWNASVPLSQAHQRLLTRAVELGYGEADNSAVIKAYESP